MQKILTFAWKQVHRVYSDKGLLVFMLLTPVAIATIIGLAFGGQNGTLSIENLPIAVVNLDTGAGGSNYGATIASILLSTPIESGAEVQTCSLIPANTEPSNQAPQSLDSLLDAVALDDPTLARASVEDGTYIAAIIIPNNFTAALTPPSNFTSLPSADEVITIEPVTLEIYANGASPISASIIRSITESIVNQITTGSVTINATISTILMNPRNIAPMMGAEQSAFDNFSCAFTPELSTIQLIRQPLNDVQEESAFVQILVAMGSAQAVFFAIFTMNNTLLSIYSDRDSWILQRLLMSPTPRLYIIFGKILGAVFLVLFQVGLLLLALTLVASIVMGQALFIWGTNIPLLILLTLIVALSVSGLGVFIVGIANSPQQAQIIGSLAAMAMAILGGAFGFSLGEIGKLSIIYWGVNAYASLSAGNNDIALNLLVLLVAGGILFIIGAWFFNKRVEV